MPTIIVRRMSIVLQEAGHVQKVFILIQHILTNMFLAPVFALFLMVMVIHFAIDTLI